MWFGVGCVCLVVDFWCVFCGCVVCDVWFSVLRGVPLV